MEYTFLTDNYSSLPLLLGTKFSNFCEGGTDVLERGETDMGVLEIGDTKIRLYMH